VLAEILRRDPQALLVLFHGARTESWGERLMQRLRRSMPDGAARVVLLPFLKVDVFLGLLQTADAVLDTPHFDCGTTSLEALGVGIPVVTWPGIYAKSRRTQAFYRRMQIDGPIASDAAHYVELRVAARAGSRVARRVAPGDSRARERASRRPRSGGRARGVPSLRRRGGGRRAENRCVAAMTTASAMLLMIDNYDSFTYNLVQYWASSAPK
jgi:predicted O-linked N-acetylglucosamine transferase (SPINDLY family)